MKRVLFIGTALVLIASSVAVAFAASDDIVGKKVEGVFKVKVDGKELEKQAIVIDGTSYLPVRSVAESLGLKVQFDPHQGISLEKEVEPMPEQSQEARIRLQKYSESNRLYEEKASGLFEVKSTKINLPNRGTFLVSYFPDLDGEVYVPLSIFTNYITNETDKFIEFKLPNGRSFSAERSFYFPGCDMFYVPVAFREDLYFLKLSLTGYSVREDGKYLIIE